MLGFDSCQQMWIKTWIWETEGFYQTLIWPQGPPQPPPLTADHPEVKSSALHYSSLIGLRWTAGCEQRSPSWSLDCPSLTMLHSLYKHKPLKHLLSTPQPPIRPICTARTLGHCHLAAPPPPLPPTSRRHPSSQLPLSSPSSSTPTSIHPPP